MALKLIINGTKKTMFEQNKPCEGCTSIEYDELYAKNDCKICSKCKRGLFINSYSFQILICQTWMCFFLILKFCFVQCLKKKIMVMFKI